MKAERVIFYESDALPIALAPPLAGSATKDLECSLTVVPLKTINNAENCAAKGVSLTRTGGWLALVILWLQVASALCLFSAIIARHNYPIAALNLAFASLTAIAAYFLATQNSKGVILAKLYLVTRVIVVLFEFANLGEDVLRTSIACGVSLLCYLYLIRSKRVKSVYFHAT
jgi:hypothetical protein